jgi:hypothetical protein
LGEAALELLADEACGDIDGAAGWKTHQDLDRS